MKKNRSIPLGYCMVNGSYALLTHKIEAVKQIFSAYLDSKLLSEIAAGMTVPYHESKPQWNKNMVSRVL